MLWHIAPRAAVLLAASAGACPAPSSRRRCLACRRKGCDPRLLGFFWTAAHFVMVTAGGLEVHSVHPSLQGLRMDSSLPLQASQALLSVLGIIFSPTVALPAWIVL